MKVTQTVIERMLCLLYEAQGNLSNVESSYNSSKAFENLSDLEDLISSLEAEE